MTTKIDIALQEFLEKAEEGNFLLPPLPNGVAQRLVAVDANYFSTDGNFSPFGEDFDMTTMHDFFDDSAQLYKMFNEIGEDEQEATDKDIHYFAYGFAGRGLQSWQFEYLLSMPSLRLVISIPYANAFTQSEDEQELMQAVCDLLVLCQYIPTSSQGDDAKKISLILTDEQCLFSISNAQDEVINEGNSMDELLDVLTMLMDNSGPQAHQWISV